MKAVRYTWTKNADEPDLYVRDLSVLLSELRDAGVSFGLTSETGS